jgi:hypothetical protein
MLCKSKILFILHNSQTGSLALSDFYMMGTGDSSPGSEAAGM